MNHKGHFSPTSHQATTRCIRQCDLDLPIRYIEKNCITTFKCDISNRLRPYAVNLGPFTKDVPFCTNPESKENLYCAFRKRMNPKMPDTDIRELDALSDFVNNWLEQNVPVLPTLDEKELFNKWIDENKNYTSRKKQRFRRLHQLLYKNEGNYKLPEKYYVVKSFVKREFYEETKNLRFINSRTDEFKVRVGGFIHKLESILYENPYFVKYKTVTLLPHLIKKLLNYKWVLETDYTSFESGFSPEYVTRVEVALFRHCFKNNRPVLNDLMRCYYHSTPRGLVPKVEKIYGKGYSMRLRGCRMSGEMWTSLGNGFSNLMNMLYLIDKYHINAFGYVDGDDGIFGMDSKVLTEVDFEKLGFKIKMQYSEDLSCSSFCGNIFDPTECLQLVPPEQISRLCWTCSAKYINSRRRVKMELLRGKAMSLYCLGKYTPIASVLAKKVIQLTEQYKYRCEFENVWWENQVLSMWSGIENIEITESSRQLYQQRFHIPIQTQLYLEQFIESCTSIEQLDIQYRFMPYNDHNLCL